ncbi:MAG: hypothetical protein K1X44_01805 [Alphaproteobacteria bacterium]|nr:hypothetical protein [Alphaproteobacteria bacterium]
MLTSFNFTYCESINVLGFLQPFNILSSLIFFILAIWIWRDPSASFHRWGLLAISLGSVLWHATPISWTLILDISAIGLWLLLYLTNGCKKLKLPLLPILSLGIISLLICGILGQIFISWLPMMSGAFIPPVIITLILALQQKKLSWIYTALSMTLAIIARELDLTLCPWIPIGTHFLWHIGTGLSLIVPISILKNRYRS